MRVAVDSATSVAGADGNGLTTPIRLITNQAKIKIVLRRKVLCFLYVVVVAAASFTYLAAIAAQD